MILVNQNRKVLMTSVNRPRVNMISPQVRNWSSGLNSAFTTPKINASQRIETRLPRKSIPGTIKTARYNAIALIAKRSMNFVIVAPLVYQGDSHLQDDRHLLIRGECDSVAPRSASRSGY